MRTTDDIVASLAPGSLPGRAITPEAKRAAVERLLAAWLRCPDLRLGQMIDNTNVDLFYVEDDDLLANIEMFTRRA
jgi:hypothetical protein